MSPRAALRLGRALRHRNDRLFFLGQGVSVIGTWVTKFATSWLAYRMTGSPLILGLVAFCNNAPTRSTFGSACSATTPRNTCVTGGLPVRARTRA